MGPLNTRTYEILACQRGRRHLNLRVWVTGKRSLARTDRGSREPPLAKAPRAHCRKRRWVRRPRNGLTAANVRRGALIGAESWIARRWPGFLRAVRHAGHARRLDKGSRRHPAARARREPVLLPVALSATSSCVKTPRQPVAPERHANAGLGKPMRIVSGQSREPLTGAFVTDQNRWPMTTGGLFMLPTEHLDLGRREAHSWMEAGPEAMGRDHKRSPASTPRQWRDRPLQ